MGRIGRSNGKAWKTPFGPSVSRAFWTEQQFHEPKRGTNRTKPKKKK